LTNESNAKLVEVILAMGSSLNLKVVAEGVEEKYQANHLRKLKCDYIQGFFYSKPLPGEDLIKLLPDAQA
jgi:EAL domain-containing protein (putative c-di-GMP-specific phosphodiesterase class I)